MAESPAPDAVPPDAPPGPIFGARLRLRDLFLVEAVGVRTVLASVAPLVLGQLGGNPKLGLLLAVGGLQAAFLDTAEAGPVSLVIGAVLSAGLALAGGLASQAPAWLAIVLIFFIVFRLGMLGIYGNVAANLGFVLTLSYAFAQNTPVSPETAGMYLVTFLIGGAWSAALTLGLWALQRRFGSADVQPGSAAAMPVDDMPAPPKAAQRARQVPWVTLLVGNLTLRSSVFQHALRTAVAVAVAVAICRWFNPPHGYWLILSCLVILKPDYAATRRRTFERIVGTLVGGLIALFPAAYIHNLVVLDILLAGFGLVAFSQLPRNYGLYVVFLTPFVVLLSTIAVPSDATGALARIYQTLLGGGLAWSFAFLLRSPRHYLPMLRRGTGEPAG